MSSDTTATPIDAEKLDELRELFDEEEDVVSLFRDFMEEVPLHLEELRRAIQDHCGESVHRTSHTLKGSSGGLGASGVHEAAFAMEQSARCEDLKGADELLQRLDQEVERLRAWLQNNQLL